MGWVGLEYIITRESIGYSAKNGYDNRHSDTLKTVVRQYWKEKLDKLESSDKSKRGHVGVALERHLSNMTPFIDPIDYEAFCVPNIIQHSKHMQREDFLAYLGLIEAIGVGYSSHVGKELTNLLLIGITSKGRSVSSAERYLATLTKELNEKADYYKGMIDKKNRSICSMAKRLDSHQSSLFRFFRRRKISLLNRRIRFRNRELAEMKGMLDRYSGIISSVNSRHSGLQKNSVQPPPAPRPPQPPDKD